MAAHANAPGHEGRVQLYVIIMTLDEFKIKVKAWLKANGHDYPWLAKQLNGVSESTIRNWMARKDIPQAKRVEMAAVCDIDIESDPVGPLMKDGKEQLPKRHRRTKEEILADKAKQEKAAAEAAQTPVVAKVEKVAAPTQEKPKTQEPDVKTNVQVPEEKKQTAGKQPAAKTNTKAVSSYTLQLDVAAVYVHRLEVYAAKHGKTGADLLEEFFRSLPQ